MKEIDEILDTIRKPFEQEKKTNCGDQVVINGLGNYVIQWVDKARSLPINLNIKKSLSKLKELFADYPDISPMERLSRIDEANRLIQKLLEEKPEIEEDEEKEHQKTEKSDVTEEVNGKAEVDITEQITESIQSVPVCKDVAELELFSMPIHYAKGIGEYRAAKLRKQLKVHKLGDLIEYYPRDYLDRSRIKNIYNVGHSDEFETIQGKVVNHSEIYPKKPGAKKILKIMVYDKTAIASLVCFGRMGNYLKKVLQEGTELVVSGKFEYRFNEIQTSRFEFEVLEDEEVELIHTGRIVPKYSTTAKLTQRSLRQWVKSALDNYGDKIPEILPMEIRKRHNLIDRRTAILQKHFPDSEQMLDLAHKRIVFDELFLLELGLAMRKKNFESTEKGIAFSGEGRMIDDFLEMLPFELTDAQKRSFEQVKEDMLRPRPMNRLIQGDVGAGKTVVAAMALLLAIQDGYQGALMAPTEILAEQHYLTLSKLLTPLALNVVLLKSDMRAKEKRAALEQIENGSANIAVGTHALIQKDVDFKKLGLVITDEQHRFGVMQRARLRKKGETPDALVMTATPIPRTLALTVYGDLDVSIIDELPPGRRKVNTNWVPESKREDMYKFIQKQIKEGRQAFIVYPLVEESEKLEDIKAATEMSEYFQDEVFPHLEVGLLHGRMRSDEKEEVMRQFKDKEIDILVSTTVIEVGIDVPNATVILIEHAERFGLAQLHQLRGRVGRSSYQSYCLLVADPKNQDAVRRVKVMTRTTDGFEIAEEDLNIRGPGEFFGTKQAGMPDLKVTNIIKDAPILDIARKEAFELIKSDPNLEKDEHLLLKNMIQDYWKGKLDIVSIA